MKSTLIPAAPHDLTSGSHFARSAAVSRVVQRNHRITSTPRARAYRTTSGTQDASQPSSMSRYGQPLRAAKSAYCFCRTGSLGLSCSDSHDHATLPGRIQEVSASFDGGARSSTNVDAVTVARSPVIATRHGVANGPVAVIEASASLIV